MVNGYRSRVLGGMMVVVALGGVYAATAASGVRPAQRSSADGRRRATPSIVGLTRAYGVFTPGCGGCGKRNLHFNPLSPSVNVALAPTPPGALPGTWCFALESGLKEGSVAVVVSAANTGGPYIKHFVAEQAHSVLGAPDCRAGGRDIEIQTSGEEIERGTPVFAPSDEIAFSFVVEAG